ncbi:hypothetical protein RhiJN_17255 [Ceratobasidium sp. AG-Ba]|nr:hypothetical protein RhiJN_17255 [Ceratobasidium sp. AG-Ba]
MYKFEGRTPDIKPLEKCGTDHLEHVFGLRKAGTIPFSEHGPSIESIVDISEQYLTGDYREKPVIMKWLEDLMRAAETTANNGAQDSIGYTPEGANLLIMFPLWTKRVYKPSASLKRSNEYLADEKASQK